MNSFEHELQEKLIYEFKLRKEEPIDKEKFDKIYIKAKKLYESEKHELFLEPKMFAMVYLGITAGAYKMLIGGYQRAKILKDYEIKESQIQALRKRIIYEEKLHRGDLKNYSELLQYYNKYFIPLMENDFYERVLDVNSFSLRNVKPKKSSKENLEEEKEHKTGVIKNEVITDEEIEAFRERVLKEELLHKDDKITYNKFLEIYNKHFIPLSEEEFARRILDISKKTYTEMKFYPDKKGIILSTIQIPENIKIIRKEILRREKLHIRDEIKYDRFNEILDNNYLPISRVDYADLILDISKDSLRSAKYDKKRNMTILAKEDYPACEEIKCIRENLIRAYKLHKGDKITYSQFLEMYNDERFYLPIADEEFAKEIFDIEPSTFRSIKSGFREDTGILKNENVGQDEIKNLKKHILEEFKVGQKITYDELEYIYNKYYIRLSIKEYADKVLDIKSIKDLKNKKYVKQDPNNPEKTIVKRMKKMIFLGEELENLKIRVYKSNLIYDGMEITRKHFMKLYKSSAHAFSYLMFGRIFLGMELGKTNALILGRTRKEKVSINIPFEINEDNQEQFREIQQARIESLLYEGKLPNEIAEELMVLPQDIDLKIAEVMKIKNVGKEKVEKARVKKLLFTNINSPQMAIKLHININDIKNISKIIISEEIQRYMKEGLTFEEAKDEVLRNLLSVRGKTFKKEEIPETETDKRKKKQKRILKARARRISDDYNGTPKQQENLKEYITTCMKDIDTSEDDITDIDTLEEAILLLDKDEEFIKFFTRYCISKEEYKRANGFLAYYLGDFSIRESDKKVLRELYKEIKKASERKKVIEGVLISKKGYSGYDVGEMQEVKKEINQELSKILKEIEF